MTTPAQGAPLCARCESPLCPEDLRCAVCGLPAPERPETVPERARAQVLRCEQCGAAVTYDAAARAPKCAFCGAVMHLESPVDPIEHAGAWLPFKVDAAAAGEALKAFLARRRFLRPKALAEEAALAELKPLWWVGWVFDADAEVTWTADSDAGHHESHWAPHAGASHLRLERILVSASRGLTPEEASALASSFDLASAKQGAPTGEGGAVVERFDVQRSAARRRIVEAIENEAVSQAENGWIPGRRFRNVHAAVRLKGLDTDRFAFPSYVLAWRYRDRVHRAVVSGQDPNRVVGEVPRSPWKVAGLVGGIVAAVAVAILVAALLLR